MRTFDEIRREALEKTVEKKIEEIYEQYYGYTPKIANEKIEYELNRLQKFYDDQIEES